MTESFRLNVMLSLLNNSICEGMLVRGQNQKNKHRQGIISKRLREEVAQKCIQSWIAVDTFVISDKQCEIKHKLKSNLSLRLY